MKKLIIAAIVFIFVIIGVFVTYNYLKYKSVVFTLNDTGYVVDIHNTDSDTTLLKVTGSSTQRLIPGEYYYVVIGDKFNDNSVPFTVTSGSNTVTITPTFSNEYLSTLAQKEVGTISALLTNTYPSIINDYKIEVPKLYMKGEWAAGYLTQIVDSRQSPDIYRYVMKKVNNTWVIIAPPQLSISAKEYPSIPKDIVDSINESFN